MAIELGEATWSASEQPRSCDTHSMDSIFSFVDSSVLGYDSRQCELNELPTLATAVSTNIQSSVVV